MSVHQKSSFLALSLKLNIFISIFADKHFFFHFFHILTLQFAVYVGINKSYFKYVITTDIEDFSRKEKKVANYSLRLDLLIQKKNPERKNLQKKTMQLKN